MTQIVDAIVLLETLLVGAVDSAWMLPILFLVCVVDGFFPPVPSEVVLLTAAIVTWTANPPLLVIVFVVAAAGAWIGDNVAYAIGRRAGWRPLAWVVRGRSAAAVVAVEEQFRRRPESMVVAGRFVPVARVLINMAAGATRLSYGRFVGLSLIGASSWAMLTALLAVGIGSLVAGHPILGTAIAVAVALVGGVALDRFLTRRRSAALGSVGA